ncbi:hypothetical protein BJ508DRAFT_360181 [Ascobolus immersus RN42]|uniref:DUF7580 domain-containing protein n=1 Tax=Ascobolus immersus RN42 TaxID=1160509 RepID=A0A3N4IE50_ASCIM|nr:hypothetical protein BJ508DRAFT_360181 [Ascobolus immersus RN42]
MREAMEGLKKIVNYDKIIPLVEHNGGGFDRAKAVLELKRMKFCFSKKKHLKVKELAEYNQQLTDILCCCNNIIPIPEVSRRTSRSDPLSVFEKIRQNGSQIYSALKRHMLCSSGDCEDHRVCLSVEANREHKLGSHLNFLFLFTRADKADKTPPIQYLKIDRVSENEKEKAANKIADATHVSSQNLETKDASRGLNLDFNFSASPTAGSEQSLRPEIRTGRSLTKLVKSVKVSFKRSTSSSTTASTGSSTFSMLTASTTVSNCSTVYSQETSKTSTTSCSEKTVVEHFEHIHLQPPDYIKDLCTTIHGCPVDGDLGVIGDEYNRRFRLIKATSRKQQCEFPELVPFSELAGKVQIDRENRFLMAAHIASMLLQAHSTPWLPVDWSRKDICFFTTGSSIYSNIPYISSSLDPSTSADDRDQYAEMSEEDREDVTRDSIRTLGIVITELIIGKNICSAAPQVEAKEAKPSFQYSRPDHNAVLPRSQKWVNKVGAEAGPEIADVVSRCLHSTLGPTPNLSDKRFRRAIYEGVIRPLLDATAPWPEVFEF